MFACFANLTQYTLSLLLVYTGLNTENAVSVLEGLF